MVIISHLYFLSSIIYLRLAYFVDNWLLSTNHRRIAIMYFYFIFITSFSGLLLATIIRIELAYPGRMFLGNNAERYLTVISLHGIVMVFFVVIPALYGAFGNFLLPTQLGVRDVAFPRLNSFMFWVTPSGFVLILHIFLFDKGVYLLIKNDVDLGMERCSSNRVTFNNSGTAYQPKPTIKIDSNSGYINKISWDISELLGDYNLDDKVKGSSSTPNLENLIEGRRSVDTWSLANSDISSTSIAQEGPIYRDINVKVST